MTLACGHDVGEQAGAAGDPHNLRAPPGKLDGDGGADSRRRPGHERDLADEGPIGRVTHPLSIA
jgi:hypothetical protein